MYDEYEKMNYFVYHGTMYGVGTKVKFNEKKHMQRFNTNVMKDYVYVFELGNKNGTCLFSCDSSENIEKSHLRGIFSQNCEEDIEEIIEPVYPKMVSWQEDAINNIFNGEVVTDIFGGVLTYIAIMAIGIIFQARFFIWLLATVIFIWWLLDQHRV